MNNDNDNPSRAGLLVLGVGNRLLHDDGVGLELMERLAALRGGSANIEYVDGGTQGLALLPLIDGRQGLLVLDAVRLGGRPGAVHVLHGVNGARTARATSAHASSVGELLACAALLGQLPRTVTIIGIEPKLVTTGIGLSDEVEGSIKGALGIALRELREWGSPVLEHADA